jgi:hypothetical protein
MVLSFLLSLRFICPHVSLHSLPVAHLMDSASASHFNFIAGVLGFVIAVTSASAWCRACFPSVQMKILDDLLRETRQIYEQADAENLFPSENFRKMSKSMLARCVEKPTIFFFSSLIKAYSHIKYGTTQPPTSQRHLQRDNCHS